MIAAPEFLVSHGCAALLTRCRGPVPAARGDRVVIRSGRGLELGEVLCEAGPAPEVISPGELLRLATADDEALSFQMNRRGNELMDSVQLAVTRDGLPLLPLDAEVLLDGSRAIVHVLRWDTCTLTPLLEELRSAHGIGVAFLDRSKLEEHGCGSCGEGGCGSCGDGGCSTGGCGSGDCSRGAKSAAEMTAYFAALREQMHARGRVPLA
ncbi:MAG: hypothetical protein ACJ8F7_01305 [Gemmataceae bacterium]